MEIIKKYFPALTDLQFARLEHMEKVYRDWNRRINVISRRDIDFFYLRHVLHSMTILKMVSFRPGASVLDVGTGGGFPGIPLAICAPDTEFVLVDSIGKKIQVVADVADQLELDNVRALHMRAEKLDERFDFVVSRAVKPLPVFLNWVGKNVKNEAKHAIPNGILYLKGGDFEEELRRLSWDYHIKDLSEWIDEPFFETKKLVHLYRKKYRQKE
ncbi:MAG: 16S rRNA (guanine(527)-N(7))-methyltransferase RsmG [Bacteroidia bacterium]|nr:MAG: 16S rRNA (guanine(527)-N(7))-methyltransferase RsmG [Bacteroidia bacterium]